MQRLARAPEGDPPDPGSEQQQKLPALQGHGGLVL
jgi:hypothetical protein